MYSMALGPRFYKWRMLRFSGPKTLLFIQLFIALPTRSVMNARAISKDFLFVSLVTNRLSLEEVCLPSFDVLNYWLNLVAICLDDENEILLKVIASFSASRFALPSIPLIVIHSLVISVFCSKVSPKSLHFAFCVRRGGSGCHNSVLAVQASRTVRKIFSSRWQSVGRERLFRAVCTSCLYLSQLAFFRLI